MKIQKRGRYQLKTYTSDIYTWSPETNFNKKQSLPVLDENKTFCNASAGSNGEDWLNGYVYNVTLINFTTKQRIAYVACDYVQ